MVGTCVTVTAMDLAVPGMGLAQSVTGLAVPAIGLARCYTGLAWSVTAISGRANGGNPGANGSFCVATTVVMSAKSGARSATGVTAAAKGVGLRATGPAAQVPRRCPSQIAPRPWVVR